MQDIRSFFSMGSKAKKPDPPKESSSSSGSSKRKVIVDSDEEPEDRNKKSVPTPERSSSHNKKRRVIDSDDEDSKKSPAKKKSSSSSSSSKPDLTKLKPVDAADFFSSAPVKRKEVPKPTKKAIKEEIEIHSDEEFEKTLLGLEEVIPETPEPVKKKVVKESPAKKKDDSSSKKLDKESPAKKKEESSVKKLDKESPAKKKETNGHGHHEDKQKDEKKKTPTPEKKKKEKPVVVKTESTSDGGTTPKSSKKSANESILTDEERYERKRMSAALYQKFKNRQGPANPGSKEIPKGKPDCLAGLQFVVTGVLESMERDECAQVCRDPNVFIWTPISYIVSRVGTESLFNNLGTIFDLVIKKLIFAKW